MRHLILILLFLPVQSEEVMMPYTLFDNEHFGAPCSLETDIEEDTCDLQILTTPRKNNEH